MGLYGSVNNRLNAVDSRQVVNVLVEREKGFIVFLGRTRYNLALSKLNTRPAHSALKQLRRVDNVGLNLVKGGGDFLMLWGVGGLRGQEDYHLKQWRTLWSVHGMCTCRTG